MSTVLLIFAPLFGAFTLAMLARAAWHHAHRATASIFAVVVGILAMIAVPTSLAAIVANSDNPEHLYAFTRDNPLVAAFAGSLALWAFLVFVWIKPLPRL